MNRIKELRQKNNLTLKQLGKKMNMLDSTLSQYENSKRNPKKEVWQKLADFFGVSVSYLQGITYYTEDDIFKIIQHAYIYEYKGTKGKIQVHDQSSHNSAVVDMSTSISNSLVKSVVNQFMLVKSILYYLNNKKTGAKPVKKIITNDDAINLNFWKNTFSFVLGNPSIKLLLKSEKHSNSDLDIKGIISSAINDEISQEIQNYVVKHSAQEFFEGITDFIKAKQITDKQDEHNLANASILTMFDVLSKLDKIQDSEK